MSVVYVLGSAVRKRISRVARPSPTSRTPVASGSRVPAWPDPALAEDAAAARHHVVRGPAGLLVDDHQAGDAHGRVSAGLPGGSRSSSRCRRPTPHRARATAHIRPAVGRAAHGDRRGSPRAARAAAPPPGSPPRWPGRPGRSGGACASSSSACPRCAAGAPRRSSSTTAVASSRVARYTTAVRMSGATSTDGHRHHGQLVGVGQPLELLGQHLPQHLVDPQRTRVCRRAPSHSVSSSVQLVQFDPSRVSSYSGPGDLALVVRLDDVAFLEVLEVRQPDAALEARRRPRARRP